MTCWLTTTTMKLFKVTLPAMTKKMVVVASTTTTTVTCLGAAAELEQGTTASTSLGTRKLELNPGVIADILAATHAMPSWEACQMENTNWSGTTDEYILSIGIEESLKLQSGLELPRS